VQFELVIYRVSGLSPLLQHNPEKLMRQPGGIGRKKIPTPEEEAEQGSYRLPDGQLYIKAKAFRAAILSAAKGKRIGRFSAKSIVAGAVLLENETVPLIDPETDEPLTSFEIHTERVVVQRQGILRSRPMLRKWACDLPLMIDVEVADRVVVLGLLNEAGMRVGVGDYRIERDGIYGRFEAEVKE
jgi:hypothetical protein